MCSAAELLGPQQPPPQPMHPQQGPPPSQQQQQQQHPGQQHPHPDSNKYESVSFDDAAVHSDSYVSYLESDDSMTAPLSTTTSP